jgi:hypothetical protein
LTIGIGGGIATKVQGNAPFPHQQLGWVQINEFLIGVQAAFWKEEGEGKALEGKAAIKGGKERQGIRTHSSPSFSSNLPSFLPRAFGVGGSLGLVSTEFTLCHFPWAFP